MTSRRNQLLHDRFDRYMRRGLAASALLHLLLFLLMSGGELPVVPQAAEGPRSGDDRAAAAGGAMRAVTLTQPRPEVVMPDPLAEPLPDLELEIFEPEMEPLAFADFDGLLGEQPGPDQGEGREDAEGRGGGGSDEEGRSRVMPPSPRGLFMAPADRPGGVRGKAVEIFVFVSAEGQVVRDSTRLHPSTGDRRFDARLRDHAALWVFEPARRGSDPVAEWFRYEMTF